jgi:RNA polymerase sigma-70 factor, ECF subfamily
VNRPVLGRVEEGARRARLDRDRSLVEQARRDPTRFDALYRKYLAQVYSYALYELRDQHAAEDATERIFMQALVGLPRFEERIDEFTPAREHTSGRDIAAGRDAADSSFGPGFSGPAVGDPAPSEFSTFRVWLFRIARNVVANERRRVRRRPIAPLEAADGLAIPDGLFEAAAAREAGNAAWDAVSRLPEDRRRAVVLRFVDEMSTAEIAAVLGRSEGAVRVLLHRALRSIADELRGQLN